MTTEPPPEPTIRDTFEDFAGVDLSVHDFLRTWHALPVGRLYAGPPTDAAFLETYQDRRDDPAYLAGLLEVIDRVTVYARDRVDRPIAPADVTLFGDQVRLLQECRDYVAARLDCLLAR